MSVNHWFLPGCSGDRFFSTIPPREIFRNFWFSHCQVLFAHFEPCLSKQMLEAYPFTGRSNCEICPMKKYLLPRAECWASVVAAYHGIIYPNVPQCRNVGLSNCL